MLRKAEIDKIFTLFKEQKKEPKIELDYCNNFTLLVAVVLSAQSTDKGVNKVTPQLFALADDPFKMLLLGEGKLRQLIKTLGLYNNKAKNLMAAAKIMYEQHNNQVPETFAELCALPGVGRKSANVLLNALFDQHTIGVDTHVFRVSNRVGLCNTKTPDATEHALMKKIGKQWRKYAHHWLVLHGRYICKARQPMCQQCVIEKLCKYKAKVI